MKNKKKQKVMKLDENRKMGQGDRDMKVTKLKIKMIQNQNNVEVNHLKSKF